MAPEPIRTVIAVTPTDDELPEIHAADMEHVCKLGATLIFDDLSAGEDPLESALPTEWSAEGTLKAVSDCRRATR